jgi:uncharacterized MnhB-related membrane protein
MRIGVLKLLAAVIAVYIGNSATAAVISSSSSMITQFVIYTTYDSGDVTFSLASSGATLCIPRCTDFERVLRTAKT